MVIGILKDHHSDSVERWEKACQKEGLDYKTVDLTSNSWLDSVLQYEFDFLLHKPPGDIQRFKNLFDERLYIISKIIGKPIFPTYWETVLYENKKFLSYFLEAANIPHPKTNVFYNYEESLQFLRNTSYPFVAKSNIGAGGAGVAIIKTKNEARKYIKQAFKGKGIRRRYGPNPAVGSPGKWFKKAMRSPQYFLKKLKTYRDLYQDSQFGYVVFQEYIPHNYEWRVAKIGASYFAYKKFKEGEKASGAKSLGYENPPLELLDFVKTTAEKSKIYSAAFDIFPFNNQYLVNEIQTIFGHVRDHILEVNGHPGRYFNKNGKWIFEEGNFNTNESYDLRLKTALELYKKQQL